MPLGRSNALHITTDGDAVRQVKIDKGDSKFTKDRFRKVSKELGFTGSTHVIDPWDPNVWPAGTYTFTGKDADDDKMTDTATLDACEPGAAVVKSVDGCAVEDFGETDPVVSNCQDLEGLPNGNPGSDFEVIFAQPAEDCSGIDHYDYHFQCEGFPGFHLEVDPADCTDPDDDCVVDTPG